MTWDNHPGHKGDLDINNNKGGLDNNNNNNNKNNQSKYEMTAQCSCH